MTNEETLINRAHGLQATNMLDKLRLDALRALDDEELEHFGSLCQHWFEVAQSLRNKRKKRNLTNEAMS